MSAASSFLACCIDRFMFKFLGIMVGDSQRPGFIWKDLVRNIGNNCLEREGIFLYVGE